MIFGFDALIANISNYFSLNIGDPDFYRAHGWCGRMCGSDVLDAYYEKDKLLSVEVK